MMVSVAPAPTGNTIQAEPPRPTYILNFPIVHTLEPFKYLLSVSCLEKAVTGTKFHEQLEINLITLSKTTVLLRILPLD